MIDNIIQPIIDDIINPMITNPDIGNNNWILLGGAWADEGNWDDVSLWMDA